MPRGNSSGSGNGSDSGRDSHELLTGQHSFMGLALKEDPWIGGISSLVISLHACPPSPRPA